MSSTQNTSVNNSSLVDQITSAISMREPALRKEQNAILNLVGNEPRNVRKNLDTLTSENRKKLISALAALQMKSQRLLDGARVGLTVPRVWTILESITKIEDSTASVSVVRSSKEADPLSAVLGKTSLSSMTLAVDGHHIAEIPQSTVRQITDLQKVWKISTSTGRTIYLFKQLVTVVTSSNTNTLLGGFAVDSNGKLEQAISPNSVAKIPGESQNKLFLPTLRTQHELEGHIDHVYVMANDWGRKVTPNSGALNVAHRVVAVQDLTDGRPLKVDYALHDVGVFIGQPQAGRGLSDGTFFVPVNKPKPSEFDGASRHLRSFRDLSDDAWPMLIKALELKFPRELLGKSLAEAGSEDIMGLIAAASAPKERANNTGCFHGYDGQEVKVPNANTSTSYLLFSIQRPGDTPVYVVDTPEIGAGYIFTNKDAAHALASGELSARDVIEKKLHVARVVHAGPVREWMAAFDTELKKLGVAAARQ